MNERSKPCRMCGVVKPVTEFYRQGMTGYGSYCKPCHKQRCVEDNRRRHGYQPRVVEDLPEGTKRCGRCKVVQPLANFPPRADRTGTRSLCTECKAAAHAEYREAHRQELRQAAAAYRAANPDAIKLRMQRWYATHREDALAYRSQYKATHKDIVNAATHRRRSTLNGAESFTAAEWTALKEQYGYRCLMCGRTEPEIRLTVDHVVPLSAGGTNGIDNIQPLCKSCNSKKHRGIVDLRGGR